MTTPKVVILIGAIHSGKTNALQKWIAGKNVAGILTPIVNDYRVLFSIADGVYFDLESRSSETETIAVGRYVFLKAAFEKASVILTSALKRDEIEWLVVDEIGPLELAGEGLHDPILEILKGKKSVILVVREAILAPVIDYFKIQHPIIVTTESLAKLVP